MMKLFDYVFYRIYKFYVGKKSNIAETFATNALSVLQAFALLDIMIVIKIMHDYPFPPKLTFLPVILLLMAINWYRYERDFDSTKFDNKWKYEDVGIRKRNGWLLALGIVSLLLFPVLYGILKHNLGVI